MGAFRGGYRVALAGRGLPTPWIPLTANLATPGSMRTAERAFALPEKLVPPALCVEQHQQCRATGPYAHLYHRSVTIHGSRNSTWKPNYVNLFLCVFFQNFVTIITENDINLNLMIMNIII